MNEIISITCFLFLGGLILLATRYGKAYLFGLSVFITVASNVTVGIQMDAFGLSLSWGVIIYSMIYLITDVLSELYEKNTAYKLAAINLVTQIVLWAYLYMSMLIIPSAGGEAHQSMIELFSTTSRITIAALVASLGAFLDIYLYEYIRSKLSNSKGIFSSLWFRNNASTIVGQTINTTIFFTIALYGVLPNLWQIILGAILIKIIISILDTPFLYLARNIYKKTP